MPGNEVSYYIRGLLRQSNAALARTYLGIEATNLTTVDDVNVVFTDNTTGNSSTTEHGFLPKLSGNASEFLDGMGNWSVPPSGGTPGGADKNVQYNNAGAFGGVSNNATATNFFLRQVSSGTPAMAQVADADLSMAGGTANDTQVGTHGFCPALDGNDSNYLDGTGNFSNPTGGMVVGWFRYDNNTTMADPGAGDFRMNAASFAATTTLAFDQLSDPGNDVTAMIMLLQTDDQILIQKKNDSTIYGRFTVTAPPTNHGGWFEVAVTNVVTSGSMPANTQLCAIVCNYDGGGGGSGTVTNTGTLTDHALIVGNGGVDVSALASLGTTTTLLHGNAAGDPTYGPVVEADITLADNTTNNSSTANHGFLKKLDNDSTHFMDGQGNWTVPSGSAVDYFWDYMESSLIPTTAAASFAWNLTRLETATSVVNPTASNPPGMLQRTTASINNVCNFRSTDVNQFIYDRPIDIRVIVTTSSDISDQRFWGLMASTNAVTVAGSNLGATTFCGFRYSNGAAGGAGDTNWMCVFNDNAGNSEAISSGVAVVASTTYRLRITWDGTTTGKVIFYINGSSVHTSAFDFPSLTKFLAGSTLTTLANATREFTAHGLKIRQYYP